MKIETQDLGKQTLFSSPTLPFQIPMDQSSMKAEAESRSELN